MRFLHYHLSLVFFFSLLVESPIRAQQGPEVIQSDATGTEFWIAFPPNEILPFPVNSLEIFVASAFGANVELIDYASDRVTRFTLKPNEVKTLSDRKELNWSMEVRDAELPVRKALRIKADKPITVNVINSKVTTTDGFLAIPTAKWGTEYIAASYWDFREFNPWPGGFLIIAKEPTDLTIYLRGEGKGEATTSGGRSIGDSIKVLLDEGEVYLVHGDGQTRGIFDLTGSLIISDRPVGVIGFHMRTTMPNLLINGNGRNHLSEMLPPTNRWGRRYSSLEFNRVRNLAGRGDVFRVVAKDANTRWNCKYYDKTTGKLLGQLGGLINAAGGFADVSQASQPTALVEGFSVWEADKPILMLQYSCSSSWDGDQILDPFMICLTPAESFISESIFQTPTTPIFTKHYLNLIVKADTADSASLEENLKSLEINGMPVWNHPSAALPRLLQSKMPNGDYHATLVFGSSSQSYNISSNGLVRFGGYIYGFGSVDAYGWPISSALRRTSPRDTIRPVIKGTSSCGDYNLVAEELRNDPNPPLKNPSDTHQVETGIARIDSVRGKGSFNYRLAAAFGGVYPEDKALKSVSFRWEVIDKSKDAKVIYYVADHAGNITLDTCTHMAVQLTTSSEKLEFGKLRLGMIASRVLSITNSSMIPVVLSGSELKSGELFSITSGNIDPSQPITLAPGMSHSLSVQYDGTRETRDVRSDFDRDTMLTATDCGVRKIAVTGVAAIPRISVGNWDAGKRQIGEVHCAPLTIKNTGSDTLVISGMSGFENTVFSLTQDFTPPLPIVIAPKDSVKLSSVCFKSDVSADSKAEVTFSSNADGPDSVSTWTGTTLATSVSDNDAEPKPCSGMQLHVRDRQVAVALTDASITGQLTVHDLRGQVVASVDLSRQSQTPFSIGPLTPGSYVATHGAPSNRCTIRLIIAP